MNSHQRRIQRAGGLPVHGEIRVASQRVGAIGYVPRSVFNVRPAGAGRGLFGLHVFADDCRSNRNDSENDRGFDRQQFG